jgi:hypothetical protein
LDKAGSFRTVRIFGFARFAASESETADKTAVRNAEFLLTKINATEYA